MITLPHDASPADEAALADYLDERRDAARDEADEVGCECEVDWNCGRHTYTETPEDRLVTFNAETDPF